MLAEQRGRSRLGIAWALAIAVAGVASAVAAEDVEAILKRGTDMRRKGRDADALVEFQRAVQIEDSGRAWAQVALAEQALGLWLDANVHLGRALARGQEPWVKKNRQALEGAGRTIRSHLCELQVWGKPAGATVLVDGKPLGKLPSATGWFEEGSVPLEVRAPGFVTASKTLKLIEGGLIREHTELKPAANADATTRATRPGNVNLALPSSMAASTPEAGLAKRGPPVEVKEGGDSRTEPEGRDEVPVYRRWWVWTLAGTLVLAAGGTTAWIITHRSSDDCMKFGVNCGVL